MSYQFTEGQIVAVVRAAKVEGFHQVRGQKYGIVTLDDDSRWYAASGLPVQGSAERRVTPLNPRLEQQALKKGKALRLVELASIIGDCLDSPLRASENEIHRAEKALLCVVRSLRPIKVTAENFNQLIEARLDEAEKGAIEHLR